MIKFEIVIMYVMYVLYTLVYMDNGISVSYYNKNDKNLFS